MRAHQPKLIDIFITLHRYILCDPCGSAEVEIHNDLPEYRAAVKNVFDNIVIMVYYHYHQKKHTEQRRAFDPGDRRRAHSLGAGQKIIASLIFSGVDQHAFRIFRKEKPSAVRPRSGTDSAADMAKFTASPAIKKQWRAMEKKELSFLEKQFETGTSVISDAVEAKMPEKFQETLKNLFSKAFDLIFEKGTDVIEKTYRKGRHDAAFRQNTLEHELNETKTTAGSFARHSGAARTKNMIISGFEGIGFGAFGVAVPDIPIFTAMILKSVYETALSYGYDYRSDEERLFILKIIETSTLHGDDLYHSDKAINKWIHAGKPLDISIDEQIKKTSDSLAFDLLTSKMIQKIPVVGILGGTYNIIFIKNLTAYADLKYKRRFLFSKMTRAE